MRRIVIDTNVFVAAGFNPRSAAARILAGVREGRFKPIWNEPTRRETEMILRRIPHLDWERVADLFQGRDRVHWPCRSWELRLRPGSRGSEIRSARCYGTNATRHQ